MVYGYIRVSSKEQNVDRQMDALLELGINKRNVFTDKQAGGGHSERKEKGRKIRRRVATIT